MTKDLMQAIVKFLTKKKENVIVDLYIKNYNKANFYIALVYSKKVEMFKVLFIPLDIVKNYDFENYACYQFINSILVNYILETINNAKEKYKDLSIRNQDNKKINNYYIEINTYVFSENYIFSATKYLPKEWSFFYDIIVILFEHVPNVMQELCRDILAVLDNRETMIFYQKSIDFNLFKDDAINEFGKQCLLEVSFLEKVNGMYFGIVNDELVILDYIDGKNILNLYCTTSDYDKYFYSCLMAIRNNRFKNYYKLVVSNNISDFKNNTNKLEYYLCYGVQNDCFKIIDGVDLGLLPVNRYRDGYIKIIGDNQDELKLLLDTQK